MDSTSIIIAALTAGAVAILEDAVGALIKKTYEHLVSQLENKFNKDPDAEAALKRHAKDPSTSNKQLEKSLQLSGAAEDKEILATARKLLELVHSQSAGPKYEVKIDGDVKGFVQGDSAKVTMNFNEPEQKKRRKK